MSIDLAFGILTTSIGILAAVMLGGFTLVFVQLDRIRTDMAIQHTEFRTEMDTQRAEMAAEFRAQRAEVSLQVSAIANALAASTRSKNS